MFIPFVVVNPAALKCIIYGFSKNLSAWMLIRHGRVCSATRNVVSRVSSFKLQSFTVKVIRRNIIWGMKICTLRRIWLSVNTV